MTSIPHKEALVQSYDRDAARRSQRELPDWKVRERELFKEMLAREERRALLELGAGAGKDGRYFADAGLDVTCIDLSPEMVRLCREAGLRAQVMEFYKLEFADGQFEAVYALNCLLHVPKAELDRVLAEIARVLMPGGLMYMGVYGGDDFEGLWDDDWCEPKRFFSFYTDEGIQEAVRRRFELVSFSRIPLKPRKPHFQSLILRKNAGSLE